MTRALLVVAVVAAAAIGMAPPAGADHYWDVFDEVVAGAPSAGHSPYPCDSASNPELVSCLDEAEAAFWDEMREADNMEMRRYEMCGQLGLSTDECINWFTSAYEDEVNAAEAHLQEAMDDCVLLYGE